MSVSKMKKLTLVTIKHDSERIMQKLMWLGCIEVEKSKSEKDDRNALYDSDRQNAVADIKLLEDSCSVLIKFGNVKGGLFTPAPTVSKSDFKSGKVGDKDYSEIIEKAMEILNSKKELDSLENELNSVKNKILSFTPWLDYDMKLSETSTVRTSIMLGTLPKTTGEEKISEIADKEDFEASIEVVSAETTLSYVSVVYMKDREETVIKNLTKLGFNRMTFPDMTDTPLFESEKLKNRESEIIEKLEFIKNKIAENSLYFDDFQIALDIANTEMRLAETKQKLLSTERTVVLSGWIPAEHTSALERTLKNEPIYYALDDPEEGDDVPVHLVNGKPAGYFESVVEMYSPPAYGSFDPTRIMMVFFFIIFGLMLADVVYGVIICLGCLLLVKKATVSAGVKNMCMLFTVCGISCIIFGVIFGSYLGDLPSQFMLNFFNVNIKPWTALDIMSSEGAIVFLILSLVFGAVHMLTGMGIRLYVLWKSGDKFAAIFDEGSWFVLFLGIGLYFINSVIGIIMAGIGVAMLILTQGRREKNILLKFIKGIGSLYNIVSYVSDLLSYSRIMALGLSSAVVASVFNILATMGGPTVPGIIIFVLIIPLGHLLNLAINLLGTFVHTSRLQYVEFFGKFFEDGGRPFRPIKPDITHSEISEQTESI